MHFSKSQLFFLITLFCLPFAEARAENSLNIAHVSGNAGESGIHCFVSATHDEPVEGFSLGVQYPIPDLVLTGADFTDTDVMTLLSGNQPDFAGIQIDSASGTMTAGVIFGYGSLGQAPPALDASPAIPQTLMRLTFSVNNEALPATLPLQLVDGMGDPGIDNLLSSGGFSVIPTLNDGSFTVNNQHILSFDPLLAAPGGTITAVLKYEHVDPIQGYQVAISYDNTLLTHIEPSDDFGYFSGLTADAVFPGGPGAFNGIELFYPAMNPNAAPGVGLATFAAIFDFLPPFSGQVLPAGTDQSLLQLEFAVSPSAQLGTTTTIALDDSYTLPSCPAADPNCVPGPAVNYVIFDGLSISPIKEDGIVEFVNSPGFRRGNTNSDSGVDLADALFVVNYLFAGGQQPTCLDAADMNDDGSLDISDTIYLLNYLFVSGPPPAAPGPQNCGPDPTDDALDCVLASGC